MNIISRSWDAVRHGVGSIRTSPVRALLMAACAAVACGLLVYASTAARSAELDVRARFDALAARELRVSLPLTASPYDTLTPSHVEHLSRVPGVDAVAWVQSTDVQTSFETNRPGESLTRWDVGGDWQVLQLASGGDALPATAGVWVGGAALGGEAAVPRFSRVVRNGERDQVVGTITSSPVIPALLNGTVSFTSAAPSLRTSGELIFTVQPGWADISAPRLAEALAPGRGAQVLVRYPPEAEALRDNIQASVNSMVILVSLAVLAVGAVATVVMTLMRVNAERRLIGLYRAIGARRSFIVVSLTTEAAATGVAGALLGCLIGQSAATLKALADGAPVEVDAMLLIGAAGAGLAANLIGAALPAVVTSRRNPLASLRASD